MSTTSRTGRPEIPINPIAADRIKEQRLKHREKQSDVGALLGTETTPYTATSIGRYENKKRGIPTEHLEKLAAHWNVPVQYLTGETDISDPIAYQLEREQAIAAGFGEAVERHEKDIQRARISNLFDLCGFDYEYLLQDQGKHLITDQSGEIEETALTDAQLSALMENVHKAMAFELFRIQKGWGNSGNS